MRGRTTIEQSGKDREAIIVTEIPYQVNKARMIERIAALVNERRVEGIADLRDESDRDGVRVVIELKRSAMAEVVLNQLYRYSPLQTSFGVNMLARDAHAPEDHRPPGPRIDTRHLLQHFGVDAAKRGHPFRREGGEMVLQRLEIGGVRGDILPVVKLLGDDGVHDRVQHRHVAAGPELQHMRRMAFQRLAARIHDDQRRAAFRRLLEIGGGDGVVLGRVGADHDQRIGVRASLKVAVTAPEPMPSSKAATEEAWQSRVQWSTLLEPKPVRTSFWKR